MYTHVTLINKTIKKPNIWSIRKSVITRIVGEKVTSRTPHKKRNDA